MKTKSWATNFSTRLRKILRISTQQRSNVPRTNSFRTVPKTNGNRLIKFKIPFTWGNLSSMPAVWIHSQPTILRSTSVSKSNPSIIDGVDVSFSLGNNTFLNVNSTLVGCFKIWRSWLISVTAVVVVVVAVAISILHITRAYLEQHNEKPTTMLNETE